MSIKQLILRAAKFLGLFALSRRLTRDQLRILCYHGIWLGGRPHYGDCLFMDRATFARRLTLLERLGYPVIPLDEAVRGLAAGQLPPSAVVITIDDAWHGTFTDMVPLLSRHRFPATLYVTTYYVTRQMPVLNVLIGFMAQRATTLPDPSAVCVHFPAESVRPEWPANDRDACACALSSSIDAQPTLEQRWQLLKRIAPVFGLDLRDILERRVFHLMTEEAVREASSQGVDVQLHTHSHRMHHFEPEALARELAVNREHIENILGNKVAELAHFCYPSGVYNEKVFATLREHGVRSATTTDFGLNRPDANPYALKRILDCESMTDLELEARLCGFWSLVQAARSRLARGAVN